MAKHSHWDNIKHKKAANDKKKGAVIAKMGKLIAVAVQLGGPNPVDNPRLRLAIDKARAGKMTMDTIERAIKKAAGDLDNGKQMVELVYEGYGPGGVAVVLDILTDNRNRTAPEIKKLFERAGSAIGAPGCVAWQFKPRSLFLVEAAGEDAVMEALLAADADAGEIALAEPGQVAIEAEASSFDAVQKALAAAKIPVISAEMAKVPDNRIEVMDPAVAQAFMALVDALEEHDDVQEVWHNADLPVDASAAADG
jgi:YebC/PmpR family DNA-binding regulatory protein